MPENQNTYRIEDVQDYLTAYLTEEGLDFSRLFNDNHLKGIKLLWNNQHFVSTAKLLVSFIDTLAFLEYGDVPRNFHRWLDAYVDLKAVNITADELWEFRNSILHMTNIDSRKVIDGKIRRLIFHIGALPADAPSEDPEAKYFDLWQLMLAVFKGLGDFCASFNTQRDKFPMFVERYDSILSDTRYLRIHIE